MIQVKSHKASLDKLGNVIKIISRTPLIMSEFLSLVAGTKPVLTCDLTQENIRLIQDNFSYLNITIARILNNERFYCLISSDKLKIKKLAKSLPILHQKCDFRTTGQLLGYPECCIKNYIQYTKQNKHHDSRLITYESYLRSNKPSFLLNNLFNFSTRLKDEQQVRFFNRYYKLNQNFAIPIYNLQFISHIPCRYDCIQSMKLAKEMDNLLKIYAPKEEKIIRRTLSKPVLFFDVFELMLFDGYVKNGILYYKKVLPPFFFISPQIIKKIQMGNIIHANDKRIIIMKDKEIIFRYQKRDKMDGFILDFK